MRLTIKELRGLIDTVITEVLQEKYIGFKKLKGKLAHEKGVEDPGALAASIGRKKYGKKRFQRAAAKGKKLKGG